MNYQSGLRPGDSCINQLLCITHDIYQSLDDGLETIGVLFDISKTFDKVLLEDLLFKLKQNGMSGNMLNVITNFLYQRKQRVVLRGQHSSWTNIKAGSPKDLSLDHYFYLMAWLQILNYLRTAPLSSLSSII